MWSRRLIFHVAAGCLMGGCCLALVDVAAVAPSRIEAVEFSVTSSLEFWSVGDCKPSAQKTVGIGFFPSVGFL